MAEQYAETIDKELEELIPMFMANTRKEVEALVQSLENKDWNTVKRLGHSTKGAAYGYGFRGMGDLGLKIEDAADGQDESRVRNLVEELNQYLDNVQITFE